METLKAAYIQECSGKPLEAEADERVWLTGALAMSLGFVHAFEQEVDRSRTMLRRWIVPSIRIDIRSEIRHQFRVLWCLASRRTT